MKTRSLILVLTCALNGASMLGMERTPEQERADREALLGPVSTFLDDCLNRNANPFEFIREAQRQNPQLAQAAERALAEARNKSRRERETNF